MGVGERRSRFEAGVLGNNPAVRARMCAILDAALEAVRPDVAVRAYLRREGERLIVGGRDNGREVDLAAIGRVIVLGAGKAGAPMAEAVEAVLGERIDAGLVVVKEGHGGATASEGGGDERTGGEGTGSEGPGSQRTGRARTGRIEIVEAGHPVPTQAGLEAGRRVLELARSAGEHDLVIVLLSGGGSALLEATDGVTLADLQAMTALLLACGATIGEINCLRKHVSIIKGGQLARAVQPAQVVTLVLSDVVGSPLDVIASGPTVPDSSTWADAWAVVRKYGLEQKLPAAISARLGEGLGGRLPDTPKAGDPAFARSQVVVVGDNRLAAEAACRQAEALGYHALLLTSFVEGEAREVAKVVAALAKEEAASERPMPLPACLVLGGETTVTLGTAGTLGDGAQAGKGGRNQELGLAAALALAGLPRVTVAALATDGSDGPTDSAGSLVDGGTCERARALGLSVADALQRHDAYPLLEGVGDLLRSGPTQTNVNDLLVVLVEADSGADSGRDSPEFRRGQVSGHK